MDINNEQKPRTSDPGYQAWYYQHRRKPRQQQERQQERVERMTREGKSRLKRGPARRHNSDTLTLHLKFTGELRDFIEASCESQEYQTFFERLVKNEFLQSTKNS